MKNSIISWCNPKILSLLILVVCIAGCAGKPRQFDISAVTIYDISAKPDAELIEKYLSGQEHKDPLILKVPNGYALPIHLNIDTPLAKLDSDAGSLQFTKDVFLYLDNKKVLASPDTKLWAPFSDMEMIKELFDAGQGAVSLGMSATEQEGAMLSVKVILSSATAAHQ